MKAARQATLRDHAVLCGVGIHSGLPVTLTLHPADADTGVRFVRTRLEGWQDREIPADLAGVVERALAKEPADRFATAEEMYNALSPYSRRETLT